MPQILFTNDITKRYAGTIPNRSIDFDLEQGEVHCILGDTGAGKATFIKILCGLERPTSGVIYIDGVTIYFSGLGAALRSGISLIPATPLLVPSMTTFENIVMYERTIYRPAVAELVLTSHSFFKNAGKRMRTWLRRGLRIDDGELRDRIGAIMQDMRIHFGLDDTITQLPQLERKWVEIVKALYRNARILVFDNPLINVPFFRYREFFDLLTQCRQHGLSTIVSTTDLNAAVEMGDRITVMRNGEAVGTLLRSEFDRSVLIDMMVGRPELLNIYKPKPDIGTPLLNIDNVTAGGQRADVSGLEHLTFDVHAGEVLAFIGGTAEERKILAHVIEGQLNVQSGTITLNGSDITSLSVRARREAGIAYISSLRDAEGTIDQFSVAHNLILGRHQRKPFVNRARFLQNSVIFKNARDIIRTNDLHKVSATMRVEDLNSSDRQKIVVARELSADASLIVAIDPTIEVDLNTAEFIYKRLLAAKIANKAIILITSDTDEALLIADRIAVLQNGSVQHIFQASETDKESLSMSITSELAPQASVQEE